MALQRFFSVRTLVLATWAMAAFSGPARADALQDIGKLMKQGQQAQALEQVDKYLSGKPKDAQGRFLKGLILTEMNKLGEATTVFSRLTEDYPELPEPYNNLAVIYAQQKQYDKAKHALEMAIRTHPSYATAHENLGDIYARLASQAYDKALQLDSSNASAQTKLATIKDLISVTARPVASPPVAAKAPTLVAVAAPRLVETKPVEVKASVEPPKTPVVSKPLEAAKPADTKPADAKPVDAGVVAATVAKPAETARAATDDAVAGVTKAIDGWLAAWSRKDVKAYLAHYARDFRTPGGETRAAWESERTKRIGKPGAISVTHEGLRAKVDGDTATVRFRQHYKSASLKTSSNKVVVFVRHDGRWLIQQEKIGS